MSKLSQYYRKQDDTDSTLGDELESSEQSIPSQSQCTHVYLPMDFVWAQKPFEADEGRADAVGMDTMG
ncbi:hypothetical protein AC578_6749 [Pseudocercospora eumusae]|uniref:Uncharacterized protein n=1 Tax=Pseudocercospora eumusae TaxID=321146 RepID=A0A139HA77_9PEZI|nr:hypothetical protein AC578_6749 [Pseudocercospora eumusae]